MTAKGYQRDLAYIHDVGFSDYVRKSAPGLLRILRSQGIQSGLVVDLGCGAGQWAQILTGAGYDVLGIDISPAMISLARKRAPDAIFRVGSMLQAKLPRCAAVTSTGECLNYSFDLNNSRTERQQLFARVYKALSPSGVFVLDFAGPQRIPVDTPRRNWIEGADWTVMVETDGNRRRGILTRRIVSFRKVGGNWYRRGEETHRLQLYKSDLLKMELTRAGFTVEKLAGFGRFRLLPGIEALLAVKPA